ncbi:MAG: 50S ribosomal protein L3 [Clostridiales bacterium]|nr:50S ribosomal protein L3 [Clostridiales bacterium]
MNTKIILGKKVGMTQFFLKNGDLIAVTAIEAGPCSIIQKTEFRVQVGFLNKKKKLVNKPLQGHFNKAGVSFKRFVKEFNFSGSSELNIGDEITLNQFEVGDAVDISAISKGKGFAGTIKRHRHKRGPMSHGSGFHRQAGSMGAIADPARVFKGQKLPGRMGGKKITVQNIVVVGVDCERNILLVKGCVPGPKNGLVVIRNAVKKCVA